MKKLETYQSTEEIKQSPDNATTTRHVRRTHHRMGNGKEVLGDISAHQELIKTMDLKVMSEPGSTSTLCKEFQFQYEFHDKNIETAHHEIFEQLKNTNKTFGGIEDAKTKGAEFVFIECPSTGRFYKCQSIHDSKYVDTDESTQRNNFVLNGGKSYDLTRDYLILQICHLSRIGVLCIEGIIAGLSVQSLLETFFLAHKYEGDILPCIDIPYFQRKSIAIYRCFFLGSNISLISAILDCHSRNNYNDVSTPNQKTVNDRNSLPKSIGYQNGRSQKVVISMILLGVSSLVLTLTLVLFDQANVSNTFLETAYYIPNKYALESHTYDQIGGSNSNPYSSSKDQVQMNSSYILLKICRSMCCILVWIKECKDLFTMIA